MGADDASQIPFGSLINASTINASTINKGGALNPSDQRGETILDRIVRHKQSEIAELKSRTSENELAAAAAAMPDPRQFKHAIASQDQISLIAEVKKASPSKGIIRDDFDALQIARCYESAGATCVSVLTDEAFFQGHLDYLRRIATEISLPVLRKDFILDPIQVYEARAAGADAVLLIAECLDDASLGELRALIESLGMTALVEFYEPTNGPRVVASGATLIGVNNRNLHTFETDLDHTIRMGESLPSESLLVGESGVHSNADVRHLAAHGVDAVLVGESLMRNDDIVAGVRQLMGR